MDGLGFALLTGCGGEDWLAAAAAVSAAVGVPIDVHVIGTPDGLLDPYSEWAGRREVESSGCVLVRPDRHVAWRSRRIDASSTDELLVAVQRALGWPTDRHGDDRTNRLMDEPSKGSWR